MAWPKAVLFDLDGTLIDSAAAIADAINQVIAARGGTPVTVAKVRTLVSRGASELITTCLGASVTRIERDLADFRAIYGALKPDPGHLYPGAVELLNSLNEKGIRLGICTNKPQGLTDGLLAGLGLAPLFCAVVGGDAVPRSKPHPDHLHAALAKMGIGPPDVLYVGDSEIDAEAAQKAGIFFVLAAYGYAIGDFRAIPHQGRIEALADLLPLLKDLADAR